MRILSQSRTPDIQHRPPQRRATVPRLEVLEDRTVLSPVMVTSSADHGGARCGKPSSTPPAATRLSSSARPRDHADHRRTGRHQEPGHRGAGADKLTISGNNASRVFDISAGRP